MTNSSSNERNLVNQIAEHARQLGGRAFLVGGYVRDFLLGTPGNDFDLEIYGLTQEQIHTEIGKHFPLDLVGQAFGVFKVKHHDIEIALPRTESKTAPGHKGFDIESDPNLSYDQATARRDFTINAIMMDPLTGELVDPWNGRQDLQNRILRHVSHHFSEDPLRVLRAMQFVARFDFDIAPETIGLCKTLSQDELPIERIGTEWDKLFLKGIKPSKGLDFLLKCDWIRYYPELKRLVNCPQTPQWHPEGDVWNHTLLTVDAAAELKPQDQDDARVLMVAALCHDLGKPATTTFDAQRNAYTSIRHEVESEKPTRSLIKSIWTLKDLPEQVVPLVLYHMRPHQLINADATDKAIRKLALDAKRLDLLLKLCLADIKGTQPPQHVLESRKEEYEKLLQRANELDVHNQPPKQLIQGRHLIERGLKPGPHFAPILQKCFEAQIDGEFNTMDQALQFLDSILENKTQTQGNKQ